MSIFQTTLNGQDIDVEYSYTEGFAGSFDEPPSYPELEILAIYWTIKKDLRLPITSKSLPPVTIKDFVQTIDIIKIVSERDLELLEEEIQTRIDNYQRYGDF